ncbi:MAG TPA: recombinase family protein [Stellaceae bacterium]|nr:recombinase family protein [Stellaceae bacterium]
MATWVAYYRVSAPKQGRSGLGLEAQRTAVRDYLRHGDNGLIGEYIEVESGKRAINRPQLAAALAQCKARGATLIIAKLDRLARNVAFIANLMESTVEFVAADNPSANRLMLHVAAAFAEHEAHEISARTKAALSAAKARGVKLGVYGATLAAKKRIEANENAKNYTQIIRDIRASGIVTVRGITSELNKRGISSVSGRRWHVPTVHRLLRRLSAAAETLGALNSGNPEAISAAR